MYKIKDKHPPAHQKYCVIREDKIFTATVCYGMHAPWWIVHTMDEEAEPLNMLDTDLWCELRGAMMSIMQLSDLVQKEEGIR